MELGLNTRGSEIKDLVWFFFFFVIIINLNVGCGSVFWFWGGSKILVGNF